MRWYRSRLILLGLTLCVVHVVSDPCRPSAKQAAASAKRSDIVFEAKLDSWTAYADGTLGLNMTTVKNGLNKSMKAVASFRKGNRLALRIFTDAQLKTCFQGIDTKAKAAYFFFLKNDRTKSGLFELHAAPVKKVKSVANAVADILNPSQTPVKAPKINRISKGSVVKLNKRLKLDCDAEGYPSPTVTWFKDGKIVDAKKGRVKVSATKPSPSQSSVIKTLRISKLISSDMGRYSCVASNSAGNDTKDLAINARVSDSLTSFNLRTEVSVTVKVKASGPIPTSDGTTANYDSFLTIPCATEGYCLNGGSCRVVVKLDTKMCRCSEHWTGKRCEMVDIINMQDYYNQQASLQLQRTLIYIGIVIAVLVFITICIASYILSKRHVKRRSKATPAPVSDNARGDPVITAFKEPKGKRIEGFSSSDQVNSKKELNQTKNDTTAPFPPVEKRNGAYPGPRQRLAANSYYDNNPDQSENIEMKPVEEALKTEMSHDVPLTLSSPLISSPPQAMHKSEGRIVGKHNHLPICESKSDRDFTRIGNHLNENSPLLNEVKMRQSQTCPKMNSPVRDKPLVESSDSDEEMDIPNAKYDSLYISEDELSPSKENLDSSSGSGDLSPTRLARREDKVKGLLPTSNAAKPAMRKYQSEEGPALNIQTNKIHKLHLQDSIRSHSLDEPSALEMGIYPTHLNSTMPGSPDGGHCTNFSHPHNHNSYDPNDDDVPWDGNKARSFSQLSEEEMYRLRDVLPNQQPIPI